MEPGVQEKLVAAMQEAGIEGHDFTLMRFALLVSDIVNAPKDQAAADAAIKDAHIRELLDKISGARNLLQNERNRHSTKVRELENIIRDLWNHRVKPAYPVFSASKAYSVKLVGMIPVGSIFQIKAVRELTGLDLKAAKDLVEKFQANPKIPIDLGTIQGSVLHRNVTLQYNFSNAIELEITVIPGDSNVKL